MYKEDLEVPVFIMNDEKKLNPTGTLINSMDTTAIFLSEMGIEEMPKMFKGEQLITKNFSISEHGGRGTSDLLNKDLYFTITTKEDKLFLILKKNHLIPTAYFNLIEDPNEFNNLLRDKKYKSQIEKLVNIVIEERKEVLEKRDYKVFDFLNNNPLKINTKSIW